MLLGAVARDDAPFAKALTVTAHAVLARAARLLPSETAAKGITGPFPAGAVGVRTPAGRPAGRQSARHGEIEPGDAGERDDGVAADGRDRAENRMRQNVLTALASHGTNRSQPG